MSVKSAPKEAHFPSLLDGNPGPPFPQPGLRWPHVDPCPRSSWAWWGCLIVVSSPNLGAGTVGLQHSQAPGSKALPQTPAWSANSSPHQHPCLVLNSSWSHQSCSNFFHNSLVSSWS